MILWFLLGIIGFFLIVYFVYFLLINKNKRLGINEYSKDFCYGFSIDNNEELVEDTIAKLEKSNFTYDFRK